MATNGLVVMTPTSVAKTGASSTATINSDGSVTFGSCETLSLNGVFTADYDNYMMTVRHVATSSDNICGRLRTGTTDATASDYTRQYLWATNTTVSGARQTTQTQFTFGRPTTTNAGDTVYIFGPYLSQPTATRNVNVNGASNASIETDNACTHSLSTSYDGLTVFSLSSVPLTGLLTVFGFNQ